MSQKRDCPFCALPPERVWLQNELALLVRDGFPVSQGHSLVIPRRHIGSFFGTTSEERSAMMELLDKASFLLRTELGVDAFNIGINDGAAAGQTVPHVHVHLIPRRGGDVADPRGGVRWVIPAHASYWD